MVPHTHDDVGWLKTVDQYYTGQNNSIQLASVQYILESIITSLEDDINRKFIYVEQAFFYRFYNQLNLQNKKKIKNLINNKQIEFVTGGWCMHDEATTHYIAMIDQMTLGHDFLKEEFDYIPTSFFSIDPFGHSSTQASLINGEMGFNSLYFGRIDFQELNLRIKTKETEFIWRSSPSLGKPSEVFTGVFQSGNYGPPSGFCYDIQHCTDEPIQDDPNLEDYNVDQIVDQFVEEVLELASHTKGDVMLQLGSDFHWNAPAATYLNYDKLIHYVNLDGRINCFYSTPSEYTLAKYNENIKWSVKTDDFFPYADSSHSYWTGYFTSRPLLKYQERITSGYLQSSRQIEYLANLRKLNKETKLFNFEKAQAVAQHHDAVSGTSKQHVAYDYSKRLDSGYTDAINLVNEGMIQLLNITNNDNNINLYQCKLINESICEYTQENSLITIDIDETTNGFSVFVYNPLGQERAEIIDIPVSSTNLQVTDNNDNILPFQITPSPLSNNLNAAPYILKLPILHLQPLSFKQYHIRRIYTNDNNNNNINTEQNKKKIFLNENDNELIINNNIIQVIFNKNTGRLQNIKRLDIEDININIEQSFAYYSGFGSPGLINNNNNNNNKDQYIFEHGPHLHFIKPNGNYMDQNSGAYIFRPDKSNAKPIDIADQYNNGKIDLKIIEGDIVIEVWQTFSNWVTQIVRITADTEYVEFDWMVGPIPIDDYIGKEVVSLFQTDIQSTNFSTDSNGREYQTRKYMNHLSEEVAGNYYPINVGMYIQDNNQQLSILTDRSQGGTSLNEGEMEIMIHRRLLVDDSRGVGEPLNETNIGISPYPDPVREGDGIIVRGKHYLFLNDLNTGMKAIRTFQNRLFHSPVVIFGSNDLESNNLNESPLTNPLPWNVDLMTLKQRKDGSLLLRLSHNFAINEDYMGSHDAYINLSTFFKNKTIKKINEMSLSGNQLKIEQLKNKLKWSSNNENINNNNNINIEEERFLTNENNDYIIKLSPMQIKTFYIYFE